MVWWRVAEIPRRESLADPDSQYRNRDRFMRGVELDRPPRARPLRWSWSRPTHLARCAGEHLRTGRVSGRGVKNGCSEQRDISEQTAWRSEKGGRAARPPLHLLTGQYQAGATTPSPWASAWANCVDRQKLNDFNHNGGG